LLPKGFTRAMELSEKKFNIQFKLNFNIYFVLGFVRAESLLNICFQGEQKKIQKEQMEREEARVKGRGLRGTETEGGQGQKDVKPIHFMTKVM